MAEMKDTLKRSEPEPETPVAETKAEEKPAEAPAEAKPVPEAKRLKLSTPDPKALKKQVEYYLSDDNLKHDKFFHEKISADPEGWLDMSFIISCNKMKVMGATKEEVLAALKDSKLELKDEGAAVRRPGNCPLPKLELRPQHQKKNSLHAHDGGIIGVIKNVPAEQNWPQIKEKLKSLMPPKANLWFISEVTDKQICFLATAPFDGDVEFFEQTSLELGGATLKAEIAQGDLLQQGLKLLPRHIRERREKQARQRQKERNRPIVIGSQRFVNVGALRGRIREIINSRSDGEQLKPEGSDFLLVKALLQHHPRSDEKSKGMVGLKVAASKQGENRCFYIIREDGSEEDFSAKKCLEAVELNPPYAPVEKAKAEAVAESAPAAKAEEKPAAAEKGEEKAATASA
eukprot:TRINITY_DN310_c0_g1_i9.p1 TRINITY_DN310_c0_g1~~TRINITY_DN310_c0_g1_i9.p1  ORF type:complete len:402 (+),score=130.79 TRINITY_DN310_c0_g1_i9:71-1276(+)